MKKQVVYIHGAKSFSKYDDFLEHLRTTEISDPSVERASLWGSGLRESLGDAYELIAPAMPNKQNAQYLPWKIWFERYIDFLKADVTLVGWSQGGYFLVKYLSENILPVSINKLILVATPFKPDKFGDEDGGDFAFDPKNLPKLAAQVPSIHLFHSTDDFVVPYTHAEEYKKALPGAVLHQFSDRNHFLQGTFPELIMCIQDAEYA